MYALPFVVAAMLRSAFASAPEPRAIVTTSTGRAGSAPSTSRSRVVFRSGLPGSSFFPSLISTTVFGPGCQDLRTASTAASVVSYSPVSPSAVIRGTLDAMVSRAVPAPTLRSSRPSGTTAVQSLPLAAREKVHSPTEAWSAKNGSEASTASLATVSRVLPVVPTSSFIEPEVSSTTRSEPRRSSAVQFCRVRASTSWLGCAGVYRGSVARRRWPG